MVPDLSERALIPSCEEIRSTRILAHTAELLVPEGVGAERVLGGDDGLAFRVSRRPSQTAITQPLPLSTTRFTSARNRSGSKTRSGR